jgi:hypothetical protein
MKPVCNFQSNLVTVCNKRIIFWRKINIGLKSKKTVEEGKLMIENF